MAGDNRSQDPATPVLVIGLTGGIGTGKSAVADRFRTHDVPVIDADCISRELVERGQPALDEVVRAFGKGYVDAHGALDRTRLRERIFADDKARQRLEAILHPRIRTEMRRRLGELRTPYCLLVIPLLLETGQDDLVDRILVVESPLALRYQRLAERDGASPGEIDRIRATQADSATGRARADDIIENDGDWQHLHAQVDALHDRYLALAADRAGH